MTRELPAYQASIAPIGRELARRMRATHRPGCPVALEDLRYLRLRFVDFDGRARTGELVVHREYAVPMTEVCGSFPAGTFSMSFFGMMATAGPG